MKHKHRWQFVKIYFDIKYPYQKEYDDKKVFGYITGNNIAEFICECGEIKIVEVKRGLDGQEKDSKM